MSGIFHEYSTFKPHDLGILMEFWWNIPAYSWNIHGIFMEHSMNIPLKFHICANSPINGIFQIWPPWWIGGQSGIYAEYSMHVEYSTYIPLSTIHPTDPPPRGVVGSTGPNWNIPGIFHLSIRPFRVSGIFHKYSTFLAPIQRTPKGGGWGVRSLTGIFHEYSKVAKGHPMWIGIFQEYSNWGKPTTGRARHRGGGTYGKVEYSTNIPLLTKKCPPKSPWKVEYSTFSKKFHQYSTFSKFGQLVSQQKWNIRGIFRNIPLWGGPGVEYSPQSGIFMEYSWNIHLPKTWSSS